MGAKVEIPDKDPLPKSLEINKRPEIRLPMFHTAILKNRTGSLAAFSLRLQFLSPESNCGTSSVSIRVIRG